MDEPTAQSIYSTCSDYTRVALPNPPLANDGKSFMLAGGLLSCHFWSLEVSDLA